MTRHALAVPPASAQPPQAVPLPTRAHGMEPSAQSVRDSCDEHPADIDAPRPLRLRALCGALAPTDLSPEVSERLAARILATIAHDTGAHKAA
jgi:hypothetical protein